MSIYRPNVQAIILPPASLWIKTVEQARKAQRQHRRREFSIVGLDSEDSCTDTEKIYDRERDDPIHLDTPAELQLTGPVCTQRKCSKRRPYDKLKADLRKEESYSHNGVERNEKGHIVSAPVEDHDLKEMAECN